MNHKIAKHQERSLDKTSLQTQPHREEFEDLCGKWSKKEKDRFDKAIADLEKIDESYSE